MDTDHVIFSANADSLDSWDIENLKFLRKISIKDPNRKCDMETLSYVSERESLVSQNYPECEALLETAIYSSGSEQIVKQQIKEVPGGTALLIPRDDVSSSEVTTTTTTIVKEGSPAQQRVISKLPTIDMNNNLLIPQLVQISSSCPKPRKSIFESLDMTVTISSANPVLHQNKPLEDCYVMDVLMVRNESVLTDNSKKTSSPAFRKDIMVPSQIIQVVTLDDEHEKPESNTPDSIRKEMTLLRYSSSSPTSTSSEDSFASAIEKGFFEMEKTGSEGSSKEGRNTPVTLEIQPDIPSEEPSSITSTVQYIRKSQMRQTRPDECPFCGSCTRANSFTYARRREDLNETEKVSLVPTVGGEPPPMHLQTSTPTGLHQAQETSLSPHPPPYYVQLREGLPTATILSTVSSNTLKPNNFSLNRRGLVIDYSSNWEGLESYVKNLTLSTAIMRKKSMKSLLSRKSN